MIRKFAGNVVRKLRRSLTLHSKRLRRRALIAEISHCFQRLEARRVLTVNGAFDAVTGLLQVDITAGGNTHAALRQQDVDADRFFLDENADSIFDPLTEVGGLKSDLRELTVRGIGLGSVGVFQWVDPAASNSPVLYNLKSLSIQNLESVLFQTRASIENDSSVSASHSIAIESVASGNQLEFGQNLTLLATGSSGQITTGANALWSVTGVASLSAHVIDVGTLSNDSIHFGSLQFNATGDVAIHEDSDMNLVLGSSGDHVDLLSSGSVNMQTGSEIASTGTIAFDATSGDVRITSVRADGDVRIDATGNILDGDDATDDIDIQSQGNVSLISSGGSIGSNVNDIFLADVAPNRTNPLDVSSIGNYEASAVNGLIALNIGDVNEVTVATHSLWIQSAVDIHAGAIPTSLLSGRDNLALIADVDGNGSGTLFLPNTFSAVGDLRIQGHDISAADGSIDLYADRLLFISRQSESIAVLADSIDAQTGGSLLLDVSGNPTFEDLNSDGLALATVDDLNVQGASGNFLILDSVRSDAGNILIRTNSSPGDIDQRAKVSATQGSVTLWASDDLNIQSDVQAGTGAFIELFADNLIADGAGMDGVIMATGTKVTVDNGGVFVVAFNEGNVYLSAIDAKGSEVAVVSEGSILDSNALSTSSSVNVVADRLVLIADNNLDGRGGIGTADPLQLDRNTNRNAIDTQVNELAIQTSNGAYVREVDGVTLISVEDFAPGTGSPTTITSPEGPIKIQSVNGDLVVDTQIIAQNGDILLQTLDSGNVVLNQDVVSGRNLSIDADDRVLMSSTLRTQGGTVDINAVFHVTMERPAAIETTGGNVRIFSGSIQIGRIDAGTGDVSLTVRSSITDRNGTALNIRADELRMVALTGRLGNLDTFVSNPDTSRAALNTDVNRLAAAAGLGIFVQEVNGLTIGEVGEIEVDRVHFNSSTSKVADQPLEDLITTDSGPILVQLLAGDLVVEQGGSGNPAIDADGTGGVLLQTFGSGSIQLDGDVATDAGNISIRSAGSIIQLADIGTGGGSIELNAVGKIAMQSDAKITSGGGNVHVVSSSDSIDLSLVDAGLGNAFIAANRSIVDNNNAGLNVIANQLQLEATTGRIGDSDTLNSNPEANRNALETQVQRIAARSATGAYVHEQDGLHVGTVDPISITRPFINGTTSQVTSPTLSGLTTTSEGPIKLVSLAGDIVVNAGVAGQPGISANGTGNVLLQAAAGSIDLNGDVISGTGHISVVANSEINAASTITTTGGTVLLQAATISMGPGAEVATFGGNIALQASQGNVALGLLNAGLGNVSVSAQGNITDANGTALNVQSNQLILQSDTGRIGGSDTTNGAPDTNVNAIDTQVTTLAARASSGIYIQESDGLTINRIDPITVQQVRFNSTQTVITSSGLEDLSTNSNGPIKLVSSEGNIVVNAGSTQPGVSANATGNVLLQTTAGSIDLNGDVVSGTGHVSVIASSEIDAASKISTTGGSVLLQASRISMGHSSEVSTSDGNIAANANSGDIALGFLNAGAGNVSISAQGSITDSNGMALNVQSNQLILRSETGRIGGGDTTNGTPDINANALDTQVTTLAARASSGIYIQESDGVTIDRIDPITVQQVRFNSTQTAVTSSGLEDLTTTTNGPIKLVSTAGDIVVNAGTAGQSAISANGAGSVLLQASAGSIDLNGDVVSGTGHVSIIANNQIDTASKITTSGGSVLLQASAIMMDSSSEVTTFGGNIAANANSGDIAIGLLDAGTGNISVSAQGSITDANGTDLNVQSDQLILRSETGRIGGSDTTNGTPDANVNAIDTQVTTLAARASTGIYIQESDGVTIDRIDPITVQQVRFNSTQTAVTSSGLEDLTTNNNGPIKLVSTTGNIVVSAGSTQLGISANGTGNVLLQAATGSIDLTGDVVSGTGHISIIANNQIDADSRISTTGGAVLLQAATISMGSSSEVVTSGGNIAVQAQQGSFALGLLDAGSGNVSIAAQGSITDANGTALNVQSNQLILRSETGRIGGSDTTNGTPDINANALDTQVTTLAARASTGIYVQESDGLTIDRIDPITVQQVRFNSTQTAVTTIGLEDLTTTNNGPIKLVSLAGNIVVSAGSTQPGVTGNGIGDVLLQAVAGSIDLNGDVVSGTGHVSIISNNQIDTDTKITTNGGSVLLQASIISMGSVAEVATSGGNIAVQASQGNVALGFLKAGSGNVSVSAQGNITDANGTALNVQSNQLILRSETGRIGGSDTTNGAPDTNTNAIDTQVTTLAARASSGIYIQESDGVTIDRIDPITVQQVRFNSTQTAVTSSGLEDLTTISNGPIKLVSAEGNIVVSAGSNQPGISANGTGNVLIQVIAGSIDVSGDVISGSGHISVVANNDIDAATRISTTGGTVLLQAATISMGAGAEVATFGGNIAVQASQGDVFLGLLNAGTGNVSVSAQGSITDANGTALNVQSNQLILRSETGRIGGSDTTNGAPDANVNAIDTQVTTLAARASTGIYIQESDGLTIDRIDPITVQQVRFNSTQTAVTSSGLEDLTTTSNGPIKLVSATGNIVVSAGSTQPGISANGAGSVLLQANAGSINLNGEVVSGTGHITIVGSNQLDTVSKITTSGGSVLLQASAITMDSSSEVTTFGGNIAVQASQGDAALGLLNAGSGNVSITAQGSITDANGTALNVQSNQVILRSESGRIGGSDTTNGSPDTNTNAIDTQVTTLAARASSGIYIQESDGVSIDRIDPITVQQVRFNSTQTAVTSSGLEDLTTTNNGPIKLVSAAGNIVINAGVAGQPGISANGTGDILLKTVTSGTIVVNADVTSGSGHITLCSADTVLITDRLVTTDPGSIMIVSGMDVGWAAGVDTFRTRGVDLQIEAGRDILLREIDAGGGTSDVVLKAGRDVRDANDSALNQVRNVWARNLIVTADSDSDEDGSIGGPDNNNPNEDANAQAIDTQVDSLAARSSQGIYIQESDGLTVGPVSMVAERVNFNSTRAVVTTTLEDLSTTSTESSPIKLQSSTGNLLILPGVTTVSGIKASGASDVMLQTLTSGDIILQGDISTAGGDVSLKSIDDISISGRIRTTGFGDIYVDAENSAIDGAMIDGIAMSAASQLVTDSGNIMLRSEGSGDIRLGLVATGSGDVAILADGSVLDMNDASSTAPNLNVIAKRLILVADQDGNGTGSIGASNQDRNGNDFATSAIETSVDVLAAKGTQGVFIRELDSLIVGVVPSISIHESHFNSTTSDVNVPGESGLMSMGPVKLLVDRGDLQIDRPIIAREGSEYRDVSLKAFSGSIDEGTSQARIEGDYLTLVAGIYAHLHDVSVTTLRSFTLRNGVLDSSWQTVNLAANDRGDDFVDNLPRIQSDQQELLRQQHRFNDVFKEYSLYLVNDREMSVDAVIAGDNLQNQPNTSPNIYLETRGDNDLSIEGIVQTNSNQPKEGGIVLVAGNQLNLANGAILETTNNLGADYDQRINDLDLNARFYNASDLPPGVAGLFTTKIVTLAENVGIVTPTPSTRTPATHIFQQVAIQFGNSGEQGFESFISYADGYLESFQVAGQEFAQPFTLDGRPIAAEPQGSESTGLFIRQTPFQDQFLRENNKLPTDAVVRRSADFFLFENAKDPSAIVDLTVAFQPIADVISAGPQEGLPMPLVDDVAVPFRVFAHTVTEVIAVPITFIPQSIELTTVVERAADVFLYRVDYDDADEDGEPDQNELPDAEQVLKNLQENQRIPFPGIDKPEDTKPSSAQPTQIEIDRIRDALANDPETEVGVYAIIKQTSSGEKIVIEVIPVRDSEPPVQAVEETIRKIEPAPGENDGASLEIDAEGLELLPRGRF
ncbi:MAG: hypothetical protein MUF23_03220, partial [Pirellula sp.]|nr:hypothetical protein [Pirellula sp.]